MTTWRDVSVLIQPDLAPFPGNPPPAVVPILRRADGAAADVSELHIGTHTGTHVDAPSHLLDGGATADRLALEVLVGEAWVLDTRRGSGHVDALALRVSWPEGRVKRLLLRTRNSDHWGMASAPYPTDYVGVLPDAARLLVDRGVRLVGTDGLSIEPFDTPGRPTHRLLLEAGVVIVEGLDLRDVEPARYTLVCLPLRLLGADGSPARAILGDL
jgi:arylformamidase